MQGLALLVALLGLGTLFEPDTSHLLIRFARVLGYFIVCAAFSVALVLFWRFGTRLGHQLSLGQAFNRFCKVTVCLYLVGALLRSVLPGPSHQTSVAGPVGGLAMGTVRVQSGAAGRWWMSAAPARNRGFKAAAWATRTTSRA